MKLAEVKRKSEPVLRTYGMKRASVFGSTARGEAREDSDVDMLVKLGRPMGMISYSRFVDDLKSALGRDVDVLTENSLNPHLRPHITKDLKIIYEG